VWLKRRAEQKDKKGMSERKYFGTDGIRGKVGEAPITPDFVLKLGWAAGKVLARHGSKKVLIGKDTRISGYMLESALEAGLAAAGLSAAFTGPMPTPAIAYLTRTFRAEAGIVISASHNPFDDNGIKFFSAEGTKLPDEVEEAIELEMEKPITCVESAELGRASRIVDAAGRYIEFCKGTFPSELSLSGLKIVVDCANGATYHIAPNVLRELGATVIAIATQPDGMNINKNCGATDLRMLQQRVLDEKADIGLAYDGDGDRIMMVDHLGAKVDGDQILYIIAREGLRQGQLRGGVVGTLMSNMGLELALKQLGIPFVRAKVGDRYVLEKMQEKGWRLGAENSGHVILLDKTTTGDGIVASLQVLTAMVQNHMSLHDLCSGMKMLPQVLVNVRFSGSSDPLQSDAVKAASAEVEKTLAGRGRVLLRKSGTEPLIRVMVEGEDEAQVTALAHKIADAVKAV
jgi:phosphoglucosamine mutase